MQWCLFFFPFPVGISCGEPEIPLGGYVVEEDFHVHDTVHYKCHPGHVMTGLDTRTCLRDGSWSGTAPTCTCTLLTTFFKYLIIQMPFLARNSVTNESVV